MEKAKSKYASSCSLISKTWFAKIAPQQWQAPHKTAWEPDNRQPQGGEMKMGEVWANKMDTAKQHLFCKGLHFPSTRLQLQFSFLSYQDSIVSLVCALIPVMLNLFVRDFPCREFQFLKLKLLGGEVLFETSLHFETTKDHPSSL